MAYAPELTATAARHTSRHTSRRTTASGARASVRTRAVLITPTGTGTGTGTGHADAQAIASGSTRLRPLIAEAARRGLRMVFTVRLAKTGYLHPSGSRTDSPGIRCDVTQGAEHTEDRSYGSAQTGGFDAADFACRVDAAAGDVNAAVHQWLVETGASRPRHPVPGRGRAGPRSCLWLGQLPQHLVGDSVVLPCAQGACGHQPVEKFPGLLRGVAAQLGEDVHVAAVLGLGGGVGGQHESGQPQSGCCWRQRQRCRVQCPVSGAAAGATAGGLVQDRGIEQPQLQGQRAEVRQLQPAGVSQLQPQLAALAQAHASQQSCRNAHPAAGIRAQRALQGQQPR
ncbi:hypothetical protein ACH4OQ_38230 [Streptomyces luteogriseus]|uniref:hypothetical protein n=1 Tax=Streptomyces luteogriseus TaxID=68233 RepID=UPI00379900FC